MRWSVFCALLQGSGEVWWKGAMYSDVYMTEPCCEVEGGVDFVCEVWVADDFRVVLDDSLD